MSWPRRTSSPTTLASVPKARLSIGRLLTLAIFALHLAGSATAQVLLLPEDQGPSTFRVGTLELQYQRPHPDQPDLASLTPITLNLTRGEDGYRTPRADEATEAVVLGRVDAPPVVLEASGLIRLLGALVARLSDAGLAGIDIRPSEQDVDLESERDLRSPDRTALALVVSVGRISQIRTVAVGDRVKTDWKIDNEIHQKIRDDSPLAAAGEGDEDTTDLIDRRALEDYLYRLNRHSGRRVEAALSPGEEPGEVVLDYRVLESKPWYAYAQVTDTGTRRTNPWQTRLGLTHRQLTDRDDILTIDYLNAGFDDVNSINARYQAPFFDGDRPNWMNRRRGDPQWIDWFPREKVPWWGVDRLRWEVDFGFSESKANSTATTIALANDEVTSRQFQYGGRFIYEAFQHRDFFLDIWTGLRFRDIRVQNDISRSEGDALIILPKIGLHGERINQVSTLAFDVSVEGQVGPTNTSNRDALGRDGTDGEYVKIDFNLGYSTFLEPVLNPRRWRDPSTELSSTLAHELAVSFRGQYAFDYRLIPQSSGVIGGLYSVRGYSQSLAVGDTTVIGSIEYRFHLPRALPIARKPLKIPFIGNFRGAPQQVYGRPDWDLTLRAFFDAGRAIRNDQSGSVAGVLENDQTLLSAGVGAELQILQNFRARIDWATALKDTNGNLTNGAESGDSEVHVLFSILY